MRRQIFVVTRYSVLNKALHTWQLARDAGDMDRYEQQLFASPRLAERLALYKGITLPSLVGQLPALLQDGFATADLVVGVLVADRLPAQHRAELETALAETLGAAGLRYEVLTVAPERAGANGGGADAATRTVHAGMGVAIDDLIRRHLQGDSVFASVRLDDDDALAPSFLARVASYLKPDLAGMHLSFSDGLQGFVDPSSLLASDVRVVSKPKNAQGLTFINSFIGGQFANESLHVHRFLGHREVDSLTSVIVDARQLSYFRTMSPTSDIADTRHAKHDPATPEQISELALPIEVTTSPLRGNLKPVKTSTLKNLFKKD